MIFSIGCSLKVEDLPFREYPFISEFQILKDIEVDKNRVNKTKFEDNIIQIPFFMHFKINEVEGEGTIHINLYNKKKKKVYQKTFNYGKNGKYYEYLILWNKIENLESEDLYYTIFHKNNLIRADWIRISVDTKQEASEN